MIKKKLNKNQKKLIIKKMEKIKKAKHPKNLNKKFLYCN